MEPPIKKEAIIKRIKRVIETRKDKINLAKEIGINSDWLQNQWKRNLVFGPGEQANPFFTIAGYSPAKDYSPKHFHEEMLKEEEIEQILNKEGIPSKWSILTLKDDSFSSSGAKALYHFINRRKKPEHFLSKNKRNIYSSTPFSEVIIKESNILMCLERIIQDPECNKATVDKFTKDVKYALDSSRIGDDSCSYLEFSNSYNKISLSPLRRDNKIQIEFVDEGRLDNFLKNGIISWESFLSFLFENRFLSNEDSLFRLKIPTERGNKFVRLGLSRDTLTTRELDKICLTNYDFKNRNWGKENYYLRELIERGERLFPASGIEYFLLLGGFSDVFIGDDGFQIEKMGNILSRLKRFGIEPSFFGYCPQTQIELNGQSLKNKVYSYNKIIPILDFYKYIGEKDG